MIGEEWCFLKCTMFWNEVLHLWHPTPNMSFWMVHTHNYAMVFYIVKSTLSDLTSRSLCSHIIFWASTAGFSHTFFKAWVSISLLFVRIYGWTECQNRSVFFLGKAAIDIPRLQRLFFLPCLQPICLFSLSSLPRFEQRKKKGKWGATGFRKVL